MMDSARLQANLSDLSPAIVRELCEICTWVGVNIKKKKKNTGVSRLCAILMLNFKPRKTANTFSQHCNLWTISEYSHISNGVYVCVCLSACIMCCRVCGEREQ